MKKKLAILLVLMTLLTACGSSSSQSNKSGGDTASKGETDSIIIRGIISKTGSVAVYGTSTEQGIQLAVDEINSNGGVGGKQIDYKSEDDRGDATESVTLYSKFVEEGANAILGPITSKPALAVAENSTSDGIPILTPTGTMTSITENKDNVFRVCFTDPLQGKILANFAGQKLKAKSVAILNNSSDDYSKGVAEAFKEQAKSLGLEIVAEESYGAQDKDFKAQLTNISSKNPDVLLIPDYYENDVLIASQAKSIGLKSTIIGSDGWDGVLNVVAKGSESDIEGVYFTNHYSIDDKSEKVQNFVKTYKEKYNQDPSSFSALGYDAVYLYKEAFEKAKSMEYADIVEALKSVSIEGVTGNIKFGENNNPIKSAAIIKITDGKYAYDSTVEP
ncbi:ABC transporter substrate-binding protein [Peptoniphilus sp. BV3C26]|uniref:ABC transporter substrate-binding protein n=1 Tax=Peptoniphilus sp. BV3C26 TaxID=1111134 RepID=UPI0003B8F305|nr:ABC transporter substrate-binding protein [Peptoniphilus sp. BV3C26]ERT61614.1 receptor family ligand-binding protein [Peptoniphilus sp. BV3C26]